MRAALTHPASKLSKTSLRLDVVVCYVLVAKRIIFKRNLVFWIFLVVVYGIIYSHEHGQIQDTKYQAFYQRGKEWNFQRGKLCSVLMVNAGKWGMKIKKWRRWQLAIANFYVLPALSSHFSVLSKFCVMNNLLHFLLLCQSCRSLRNAGLSFGGRILGLMKSAYHGWLSMMTSSEGPLFSLVSGPPTLNPPLHVCHIYREWTYKQWNIYRHNIFTTCSIRTKIICKIDCHN